MSYTFSYLGVLDTNSKLKEISKRLDKIEDGLREQEKE